MTFDRSTFDQWRRDRLAELLSSLAYCATAAATVAAVAWRADLHSREVRRLSNALKALIAEKR